MQLERDYPASHATVRLEAGEPLLKHVLQTIIGYLIADPAGFWNADLEILPDVLNANRDMLDAMGFVHAGTVSTNNLTLIRLRKPLRRSNDGGQAVSPDHVLHPNPSPASAEELAARELVSRITTDGVEAKAAKIKADATLRFDKSEATSVPTFIERQNAVDISRIQLDIDRLSRRPESA